MSRFNVVLSSLASLTALASGVLSQKKLFILIYHRVLAEADPMRGYETDAEIFNWQMALLARYFNVLPLHDALAHLQNGTLPRKAVCITFDDGYADNVTQALPILQQYQLPATFFIASGYLNGGRMWNDTVIEAVRVMPGNDLDLGEFELGILPIQTLAQKAAAAHAILQKIKHLPPEQRENHAQRLAQMAGSLPDDLMMTHQQLRQLQQSGMEIGGHTLTHPILANLPDDLARQEIQDNKAELEQLLGVSLTTFAYPNGKPGQDYLPVHVEMIRDAGYQAALSTQWGVANDASDRWQLPRFTPWDKSPITFMLRMLRVYLGR